MPKYELSLSPSYVPDWTVVEAVRELFQNAMDQEEVNPKSTMAYLYNETSKTLTVSSKGSKLSRRSLLLGETSKADEEKTIGTFGEGYKLAFLVLAREGHKVEVKNPLNKEIWYPRISKSKRYQGDILVVDVETSLFAPKADILEFIVHGITPEIYRQIERANLNIHKVKPERYETGFGSVLIQPEFKGKIFVNGLYITDMDLEYGYNIKPKYLNIGRDRNLVNSFDIRWVTSQIWIEAEKPVLVANMIKKDINDIEYVKNHAYSKGSLAQTIWAQFVGENGKWAIPVSSEHEANIIRTNYKKLRPVIVKEQIVYITRNYQRPVLDSAMKRKDKRTPHEVLESFYKKHSRDMSDSAKAKLNEILKASKEWRF